MINKAKRRSKYQSYQILVQVRDDSKEIIKDHYGHDLVPTTWVEMLEINLGSIKNPNPYVFGVKLVPLRLEGQI